MYHYDRRIVTGGRVTPEAQAIAKRVQAILSDLKEIPGFTLKRSGGTNGVFFQINLGLDHKAGPYAWIQLSVSNDGAGWLYAPTIQGLKPLAKEESDPVQLASKVVAWARDQRAAFQNIPKKIAEALWEMLDYGGINKKLVPIEDRQHPTIKGNRVELFFRTLTPAKHDTDFMDIEDDDERAQVRHDFEDDVVHEVERVLTKTLAPYSPYVKSTDVSYGDKDWVWIWVFVKV